MDSNGVLIIGEKETFIIRVLMKKLQEANIDPYFSPADVDDISKEWNDAELMTFYLEKGEKLSEELEQFIGDHMRDSSKQIILIGDPVDTDELAKKIPKELIFRVLPRPLDYDAYIKTVFEYYNNAASDKLKKSILIVDDDPNYMGVVREWLKDTYKVSMANSGLRAIKWLGSNSVDLILLDYEMPVTDGPQVLEMLRADDDTKDIPVFFLTGRDDKESVMAVVNLKPEGYILKTVGKNDLVGKLKLFFIENAK